MKINIAELETLQDSLDRTQKKIQGQLQDAQKAAKKVVNGDALSGKVKTAINADISNHQLPMLTNYYDALHYLSQTLTERLTAFKSGVNEHSSSAVIDTEKLDALERKLSEKETDYFKLGGQFNQAYSQAAGIMSFDKPNAKKLTTDFNAAKKVLTNTKKDMASFVTNVRASAVTAILDKQASELTRVSNAVSLSYTSPQALSIYGSQDFKNATKAQHLSVKTAEKAALKAHKRRIAREGYLIAAIRGDLTNKEASRFNKKINTFWGIASPFIQDGILNGIEKVFDKTASVLKEIYDSGSPYLSKYLSEIMVVATRMKNISKGVPIVGGGFVFYDDYKKSHDLGQAITHTAVNTITGIFIEGGTGIFSAAIEVGSVGTGTPLAAGVAVGGFTINVGTQVEIDNFFEEVPMNTWQDRISEAFRIRKELNEKYIYSDHKLSEYEKDYFRKYSGNPMDTYKGLTNGN